MDASHPPAYRPSQAMSMELLPQKHPMTGLRARARWRSNSAICRTRWWTWAKSSFNVSELEQPVPMARRGRTAPSQIRAVGDLHARQRAYAR
jgi:hypothetical protein